MWTNRRWLACAALLWLGCASVYFLTAPGRIDIIDGAVRYEVTQSLIETGSPVVRDLALPAVPGLGGRRFGSYPLGTSLTAVPFVILGGFLGHGSLEAKQFAFSLASVPFAAGVVALLFLIYGRLGCTPWRACRWSLVVAFCTLLWPYAGSSFDMALQAFWLTLAVWAAIEAIAARSVSWAMLAATAFAVLINIQEAYVVLAACVLAAHPFTFRTMRQRAALPVVQVVLSGAVLGLFLMLAGNVVRFGNPLAARASGAHPIVGNVVLGLLGLSISPAKSIFLYSPTIVIALFGLRQLVSRDGERLAPIPVCIMIHLVLIACLKFWAGDWAWGPRYLVATLPIMSLGLPFAWPEGRKRWLKIGVVGLGLAVQVLAISVEHQRYYFERSLAPFFWIDERMMYTDSPLLARPGELVAVLQRRGVDQARALVPGPRPFSMTSNTFGPPPDELSTSPEIAREYLVFLVPRPWTLWSRFLPEEQRPGRTGLMTLIGLVLAAASFAWLAALVRESHVVSGSRQTRERSG